MVAILSDPKYAQSPWCQNICKGLMDELRSKRIPFDIISDTCPPEADAVFLIAADYVWTSDTIRLLNGSGIAPIVICNQLENIPGCIYSCVCSDVNSSMKNLLEHLHAQGKKSLALYGVNPNSISDLSRADALMQWKTGRIDNVEVFLNEGSLEKLFSEFVPNLSRFDAVLCANDFAAVSLLYFAKQAGFDLKGHLPLISCASSKISEGYPEITSVDIGYARFGNAAVDVLELIRRRPYLTGVTAKLAWDMENRGEQPERGAISLPQPHTGDPMYADPHFRQMMVVENLLMLMENPLDKQIVDALKAGLPNHKIAELCYFSENAVKYRIRRLLEKSGAADKDEMLALLNTFSK